MGQDSPTPEDTNLVLMAIIFYYNGPRLPGVWWVGLDIDRCLICRLCSAVAQYNGSGSFWESIFVKLY